VIKGSKANFLERKTRGALLGRIRLFNAVNLEQGYGLIEIRTPKEVLPHEENF